MDPMQANGSAAFAPGGREQPLRWWTPAQLDALAHWLAAPWLQWQRDWGLALPTGAAVQCVPAHEATQSGAPAWAVLGVRASAMAWVDRPHDAAGAVLAALFGGPVSAAPDGGESIARESARAAWREGLGRLARALSLDDAGALAADIPSALPWSGTVCVSLPLQGASVQLLLGAACVQAWLQAQGALNSPVQAGRRAGESLVAVTQALAGHRLALRVEMSGCELDLGSLQGLRLGDVVRLTHRLDAPLRIVGAGQVDVCEGYLGQRGGRKAVELARTAPAAAAA